MRPSNHLRQAFLMGVVLSVVQGASTKPDPPPVMLWAWERPTDLRSLQPSTGVAFLASTISLINGEVQVTPRFQPLLLTPVTFRMAVVRIQTASGGRPLILAQRRDAVQAVVDTARITRVRAVQLDFDARSSERPFYEALIRDVRSALGNDYYLSMTALVSWCDATSKWIEALPVDEIVPMTFEMGGAGPAIETRIRSAGYLEHPRCRESIGISADDVAARPGKYRRVYAFSYSPWTRALVDAVLRRRS